MLPERTWPFSVRPGSFETVKSYLRRLRAANFVNDTAWGSWHPAAVRATGLAKSEALPLIVEAVGGLEPGHFARDLAALPSHADGTSCTKCATGLAARFGCVRCSLGERVEQAAHDGPRVCRRHMLWVGPGTLPEQQYRVNAGALRADRMYRTLRRRGWLDAHRLAEILGCVAEWSQAEGGTEVASERFVIAVELARSVLAPVALDAFASRAVDSAQRYAKLQQTVTGIVGTDACVTLTDALWTLVRVAGHQDQNQPHSFICEPKDAHVDERADFDQLRTSAYPRERHIHLSLFVHSDHAGTRYDRAAQPSKNYTYVCSRGHTFTQTVGNIRKVKSGTGCGVCAHRRLLPGFNSLADTDPHLVASWHPTKNGDLRPEDVIAGSERVVFWRCDAGHDFQMRLVKRKMGARCQVCTSKLVDPDINSFAVTDPATAATWHPTLNGDRTPEDFVAGSGHMAWWRCREEGHEFQSTIVNRTFHNRRCRYCTRQEVHPTTSLAVTHPDAAALWHPTRNGSLTPRDVLSGSKKKVWWVCKAQNHHYFAPILTQSRGSRCNICAGRVVDEQNCMRTTRPDFARQFHPTKNGSLTPDLLMAGTSKRIFWLCEKGHHWRATGANRVTCNTGCPYCSNAAVWTGENDMATTHPFIAADWDEDRNGDLTPKDVVVGTQKLIAWKCASCGYRWAETGHNRARRHGCPNIECSAPQRN